MRVYVLVDVPRDGATAGCFDFALFVAIASYLPNEISYANDDVHRWLTH